MVGEGWGGKKWVGEGWGGLGRTMGSCMGVWGASQSVPHNNNNRPITNTSITVNN